MTKSKIFLLCTLCGLVLTSCSKMRKAGYISENKLFSLNYGSFEDQLDLFAGANSTVSGTSVTMKDGFFYIVNNESQRILSLNSFGNLLTLYYNADYSSEKNAGLSSSSIWKSIDYPFTFNGRMAVDSRKYMYVAGTVSKEKNEQDENRNLLFNQVILCISSDGDVVDYIGQQGPGGTPFPYIKYIYTTENDELVVVCSTTEGLIVYWFNNQGFLKYKVPILTTSIPRITPESVNYAPSITELFITVDNVIPDCNEEKLYVKVDYYLPHIDEDSKVQSSIDYVETLVYPLDIHTAIYGEGINIFPYEESVKEDFSKISYKLPYDFLGVTKHNWLFFIISTEKGFDIEMINASSGALIKRKFNMNHDEAQYYSLSLSNEGIISALIATKEKADVVWWRTDLLLESLLK